MHLYLTENNAFSNTTKCQALASVVLNDPNALEVIHVTAETRFAALNDRYVDVLAGGETYTVEREINEVWHAMICICFVIKLHRLSPRSNV